MARDVAFAIRAKIKEVTGLNASAGISYNKFLAKLASDYRKPNGQYVITPEMGPAFVEALPVGKFHGIGPATSTRDVRLGLYTGLDMRSQTLEFMRADFGKAGWLLLDFARRRQPRGDRIRKPLAENTFFTDLTDFSMVSNCSRSSTRVWRYCEGASNRVRTVTRWGGAIPHFGEPGDKRNLQRMSPACRSDGGKNSRLKKNYVNGGVKTSIPRVSRGKFRHPLGLIR